MTLHSLFQRLIPFVLLGIMLVVVLIGIFLLSYLFVIGAFIGFIIFILAWFKERFFPSKTMTSSSSVHQGRTIEHDP